MFDEKNPFYAAYWLVVLAVAIVGPFLLAAWVLGRLERRDQLRDMARARAK